MSESDNGEYNYRTKSLGGAQCNVREKGRVYKVMDCTLLLLFERYEILEDVMSNQNGMRHF